MNYLGLGPYFKSDSIFLSTHRKESPGIISFEILKTFKNCRKNTMSTIIDFGCSRLLKAGRFSWWFLTCSLTYLLNLISILFWFMTSFSDYNTLFSQTRWDRIPLENLAKISSPVEKLYSSFCPRRKWLNKQILTAQYRVISSPPTELSGLKTMEFEFPAIKKHGDINPLRDSSFLFPHWLRKS